jgi:glycosyltransferase involved in cell wall biosynthesis
MQLLEAFARARAPANSQHQLLIVGSGPQRESLVSRISALGLNDAVRLGGYVEAADRLLEHAAGFVMSSLTEGMPLVLLEAMQWRVPILATAVGAIPELLEEGRLGRLIAPCDPAALAAGLHNLMSEDAKPKDGAGAHAVWQRYSSQRMADEYFSAYGAIA